MKHFDGYSNNQRFQNGPNYFPDNGLDTANANEISNHIENNISTDIYQTQQPSIDLEYILSKEISQDTEEMFEAIMTELQNVNPSTANERTERDEINYKERTSVNHFYQREDNAEKCFDEETIKHNSFRTQVQNSPPGMSTGETINILSYIENFSVDQEEGLETAGHENKIFLPVNIDCISHAKNKETPVARVSFESENSTPTIEIISPCTTKVENGALPCKDRCKAYRERKKIRESIQEKELHKLQGRNNELKNKFKILDSKVKTMKKWYLEAIAKGQIKCSNTMLSALIKHI